LGGLLFFKLAPGEETIEGDTINAYVLPRVLIITPGTDSGYSFGIKELLQKNGFVTEIISWSSISQEITDKYDLLIITGLHRSIDESRSRLDINKPILAYGPYGCK
jgi:hypothetical protein